MEVTITFELSESWDGCTVVCANSAVLDGNDGGVGLSEDPCAATSTKQSPSPPLPPTASFVSGTGVKIFINGDLQHETEVVEEDNTPRWTERPCWSGYPNSIGGGGDSVKFEIWDKEARASPGVGRSALTVPMPLAVE